MAGLVLSRVISGSWSRLLQKRHKKRRGQHGWQESSYSLTGKMAMVVMGSRDNGFTALYSESVGFIRFFTMYWNFFSNWG